ncbi:MAG TPA: non-homologous end-joining DNA ligase [Pyrinomonadaceae bacterium]|jgi:bifunctional non-homologous end joining protein LigD
MGLETYQSMRDFRRTPEPKGKVSKRHGSRFVVQEHHASMLHFDFRLEMGGVLKSWSVRRGPTLDPAEKRLAVPTEDHPVEYLKFQGHIPEGSYGAGEHIIWDTGTYELTKGDDPLAQLEAGRLSFLLHGEKLRGEFHLVRMGRRENQWLLLKSKDEHAEPGWRLQLILDDPSFDKPAPKKRRAKSHAAQSSARKISSRKVAGGETVGASEAFGSKKLEGDLQLGVGRETVALTHLEKVYWPQDGYTKGDLIRYYYEISKFILPYLKDRPLIMKRYPNGIEGSFFHQHDVDEAPAFVRTVPLDVEEGRTVDYIVGDNLPTLLYMANLGAIERHPWHSRTANLERPDWVVFDLDPENVEFREICEMALTSRRVLERLGLQSHAKTSGSRGIHLYVPLKPVHDYELVAEFAEMVAALVVRESPELATVERSLKKRQRRRIYIDHMQNARGKSVVAPYSVRPRLGATVSAPLEWSEVERKKITPQDFNVRNILRRIEQKGDLFKPVLKGTQTLDAAMDELRSIYGEAKRRR